MKKTMVMVAGLLLSTQANALSFGIDLDCGIAGDFSVHILEARKQGKSMQQAFKEHDVSKLTDAPAVRKAVAHVYMDKSITTNEQAKEVGYNHCYVNYK